MEAAVANILSLKEWISKTAGVKLEDDFVQKLHNGVVLCLLVNKLSSNGNVEIALENNTDAAFSNLSNFLAAAEELGVQKSDLFSVEDLLSNPTPTEPELLRVFSTLKALKLLTSEKSSVSDIASEEKVILKEDKLEKSKNKWTKGLAETRAAQNKIKADFREIPSEDKELDDVTKAVKAFKARTEQEEDEDERKKKTGQQKWALFETNYQRTKGITLEQSLAEIEAFSKDGKLPEKSEKEKQLSEEMEEKRKIFNGSKTVNMIEEAVVKGREKKFGVDKSKDGKVVTKERKTEVKGGQRELAVKPQYGGNAGEQFFKKFDKNDKKKFKPGNENNPNKLW